MIQPEILSDYESVSRRAVEWLVDRVRQRPNALICLAAGSTPRRTYELLAERGASEPRLFAECRFVKLDEWGGLAMDDPATCEHQLQQLLVKPLGASARYLAFQSRPQDPAAECARIASWLQEHGPIDVAVLGLGVNGHVGFNEPADLLQPHTHVAELAASSLTHEMLRHSSGRPEFGITLGMADLLQSREVLLLASGSTKREPIRRLLSGQLATGFPASLLELHPRLTFLCDIAAIPAGQDPMRPR